MTRNDLHAPMQADAAWKAWLCAAILLFVFCRTMGLLTDYGAGWQHVEVKFWKPALAAQGFPTSASKWVRALDWRMMENNLPRVTRPLSALIELFDTPLRVMLWRHMVIWPSFSLTWIFSLFLTPLFLFLLLKRLEVETWIALLAVALYMANPGVLSLETMLYRPGRAAANCAIFVCLWLAARQNTLSSEVMSPARMHLRFAGLCMLAYISLFLDETALIIFPALFIFFPRLVLRSRVSLGVFLLIPAAYFATVHWGIPALSSYGGYPVVGKFGDQAFMEAIATFRLPINAYFLIILNIILNALNILPDCFGLINPSIAHNSYYTLAFAGIAALGFRYYKMIRPMWKSHIGSPMNMLAGSHDTLVPRALTALAVALTYEGLLMSVQGAWIMHEVILLPWILYQYGVFCSAFVAITTALLLHAIRPHFWLACIFTITVIYASFFIFHATNQAYKDAHYYPENPGRLYDYFSNRLNRFDVPFFDSALLKSKTEELWHARLTHKPVYDAPLELVFLLYELQYLTSTPCDPHNNFRYFDVEWNNSTAQVHCHQ